MEAIAPEKARCPACGASTVTTGFLTVTGLRLNLLLFVPSWRRFGSFRWNKGVHVSSDFASCLSCGLVWSSLEPGKLRAFIDRYGNDEAKTSLAPFAKPRADSDLA